MNTATTNVRFSVGTHARLPINGAVKPQRVNKRAATVAVVAKAEGTSTSTKIEGAGASGYAVDGNRPTSPRAWEIMSTMLRKSNVKMLSPQELVFEQERGAKIVDIRPVGEYGSGRIPGAISAEFFRLIEGWDPVRIARRGMYAFFGVFNGTEFNDRFFAEIENAVGPTRDQPLVLYCNIGGTLEPTGPSEFGQQSRSLTAAYELLRAGYSNVKVLKGGFNDWKRAERDIEVYED